MLKHLLRGGGSSLDGNSWVATLGGSGDDEGRSVAVAPDGSVYVCGWSSLAGAGGRDLLLAKFSSSGTVQWQKTLGGSGEDYGTSVAVAPDGYVYVCGYTKSAGAGSYDLLLTKFSSSGTVQWKKILGGRSVEDCNSIAVAPDGYVYVCGRTYSTTANENSDFLLIKFNSSGTVQWQKTLGGSSYDYGWSVAVAPDGYVYVCGQAAADLLLAKITDSIIEKDTVTFGSFIFKNVSLTFNNVSFTSTSSSLSVSNAGLTVTNPSLTVGTPSLTTNLYKE